MRRLEWLGFVRDRSAISPSNLGPPLGRSKGSQMKNKVYESFDKAIEDIFDGAVIAHSIFGAASQPLNLWEALSRKNVKDLTIVTNMAHPRPG